MIMHRNDQTLAIRALKSAAPYIRMYKGKTFVVKAGGGVFADAAATRVLVEQIAILHYFGVRVVLVHGGGPQLTELSAALGVPTRMVEGRRVTDQKAIDITSMVLNGLINTRVLGICRDLNIDAVGIMARGCLAWCAPTASVHLEAEDQVRPGSWWTSGFVGDIDEVDTAVPKKLLDNALMPVVSPLSADEAGTPPHHQRRHGGGRHRRRPRGGEAHPVHRCARHPRATRNDAGSLISYTDVRGLKRLREEGRIDAGMLPKAQAIEDAIRGGVRRVHVVSYQLSGRHPRGGIHQRGHRHHDRRRRQRPAAGGAAERPMKRLWDKGGSLDAQVLEYTAGEDHGLDERLVPYDVAASIAHARMLAAQQLLSGADLSAICTALEELAAAHARGEWHIQLSDEDGQTALEGRLTERIGSPGARIHLRRSRKTPGVGGHPPLPARCGRRPRRPDRGGGAGAGRAGTPSRAHRAAGLHAPAAGDAELGGLVGRRLRGRVAR